MDPLNGDCMKGGEGLPVALQQQVDLNDVRVLVAVVELFGSADALIHPIDEFLL